MRSFLLALTILVPPAWSQDTEKQIEALIEERSRSIAQIDEEFRLEIGKVRDSRVQELEEKMAVAMKSLDLEKSNALNKVLQGWKTFSPVIRRRMVFIRARENEKDKPWFFARGPNGIWVECTPDNLFQHKLTAETPEYIELSHENGVVHRLYDSKNMYRNPETKNFRLGSRGNWLSEIEVTFPDQQ